MTLACATTNMRRRSLHPHQFGRGGVPGTIFRLVVHGLNVVAEVVVHPAPETEHVVGASGMDFTVATPRSGETGGEAARPTPSFDQTVGLGRRHLFEQRHRMGEGGDPEGEIGAVAVLCYVCPWSSLAGIRGRQCGGTERPQQ